ncbi:MAG TPA: iron ABC transporter permease [Candidatus Lustribacter sp.]
MRIGRIGAAVPILYAFFTVTVIVPLAIVVFAAFTDAPPFSGATALHATWSNFAALWAPGVAQAAGNTIIIAVIGTFGALLIGSTLAWLAARSDVPARPFVHLVGIMPLFLSVLVASIAWSELASGPTAYFSLMLSQLGIPWQPNIETLPGIAFVYAIYEAPYPFLFMYAALTLVNPELEEAAAAHGASLAHVLRRITLPLLKPALLGSTLLVFALIVEDFPVPQILGVPVGISTLSTRIYLFMTSVPALPNVAAALSAVLMIVTSFFVFTQRRLLEGRDYRTLTGKGMQARELRLRRLRWPAFALVAGYALLAVGAPIFALLEGALRKNVFVQNAAALFDVHAFSFRPLLDALADPDVARGTIISLTAGAFAAVVGAIAFLSIAFVVHRTKTPGRQPLEYLAMLPVAVPALVLGLGILWTWVGVPLPVYGTVWILGIAFLTRFFPQGYRAVAASMQQIHDDLDAAARVCGANALTVARRITLPLVRSGIASAIFIMVILSLRELTASLFLYTTSTRTLSIVIYEKYETGSWSQVAAISLIFTLALMAVTLFGRRLLRTDP